MSRRRALIVLPALLAGALAAALAWWLAPWNAANRGLESASVPPSIAPPAAATHPVEVAEVGAATADEAPPAAAGEPQQTPSSPRPAVPGIRPVADLYLNPPLTGSSWDFEAYRNATATPDSVGPATAYAAFDYLKSCIGVPHSESEFEMRVEQYNILAEQNRLRVSTERLERFMDNLQAGYLRCTGLDDTDLVASALEWLQLAADLGHLHAQIQFYRELPDLLRRAPGRLFREPHYLDLHREKSIDYFQRALATGHPQAFRAYAEAILDDVLFERDLSAAYAYLYAGDLAAAGALPDISAMLSDLEPRMTAGQLREARRWGRQLCRQWCQTDQDR